MESLRGFLEQKERELIDKIAALRQELATREAELAEVSATRKSLGPSVLYPVTSSSGGAVALEATAKIAASASAKLGAHGGLIADATVVPGPTTIRDLALKALQEHFHEGATPTELREFIKNAYDRDIERSSLSPQLSKLKEDGLVFLDEKRGVWASRRRVLKAADLLVGGTSKVQKAIQAVNEAFKKEE